MFPRSYYGSLDWFHNIQNGPQTLRGVREAAIVKPIGVEMKLKWSCDFSRFIMYRAFLGRPWMNCFRTSGAKQHTARSSAVPERRMGKNSTSDYPETRLLVQEQGH